MKEKVILRKKGTFPKTYDDLVTDAEKVIMENFVIPPVDKMLPSLDVIEVVFILENEYGVYLNVFIGGDDTFTTRDIIDDLADKLGIKKGKQ